ncbi:NUDIX hydrolase [Helicobacter salomonis]|uniref:NUDIX hydrolase n=1 Tax=Helicobacter salomonis TaxID=56878 RepID=UPI000CF161D5|nr:NUDIX hydrolase [Helicobacter salomonis]
MVRYSSIQVVECAHSPYIRPQSVLYEENGVHKRWDMIHVHDSVAVLLYHVELRHYVVVKQFRPAVYVNAHLCRGEDMDGYMYELCAGLVDKPHKTLKQIACEEVLEECGYAITPDMLESIGVFHSATGISGSKQSMFFARIRQANQRHAGGGVEGECIEIVHIPYEQVRSFVADTHIPKTIGLGYALNWSVEKIKDDCHD